jgi:hypothetical protein
MAGFKKFILPTKMYIFVITDNHNQLCTFKSVTWSSIERRKLRIIGQRCFIYRKTPTVEKWNDKGIKNTRLNQPDRETLTERTSRQSNYNFTLSNTIIKVAQHWKSLKGVGNVRFWQFNQWNKDYSKRKFNKVSTEV